MFGAPELWRWGALANLSIWFDLIWLCGGLFNRLETSSGGGGGTDKQGSSMSDDVSRCYGDCSSAMIGEQLQTELVERLEVQQQTSSPTMFHQFIADAQPDVSSFIAYYYYYYYYYYSSSSSSSSSLLLFTFKRYIWRVIKNTKRKQIGLG